MDRENLTQFMLGLVERKTVSIREELAREELQQMYRLRPIYQNQQKVSRQRLEKVDKGLTSKLYNLTGNKKEARQARGELYSSAKKRYQEFSDVIRAKEKRYQKLKDARTLDGRNVIAMEKALEREDPDMVEKIEKEIRQRYVASALLAGRTLSTRVFKLYQSIFLKEKWNDLDFVKKQDKLKADMKLTEDDRYLDDLLYLFYEELELLRRIFSVDISVKKLLRYRETVLAGMYLPLEKEDAQRFEKDLKSLHRETERLVKELEALTS